MKKLIACFLLSFCVYTAFGQVKMVDTLRLALIKSKKPDTNRLKALNDLSHYYVIQTKPDSALVLGQEGYELSLKLDRPREEAYLLKTIGDAYGDVGDYVKSLNIYYKVKDIFHNNGDAIGEASIYNNISVVYYKKKDYQKALWFLQYGKNIYDSFKSAHPLKGYRDKAIGVVLYLNMSEAYLHLKKVDSADYFIHLSYDLWKKNNIHDFAVIAIFHDLGAVEKMKGHKDEALKYFKKAIALSDTNKYDDNLSVTYLDMADLFHQDKQQDSAEYYGQKALKVGIDSKLLQDALDAAQVLYAYYEQDNNLRKAFRYLKLSTAINDSMFSQEKVKQIMAIDFDQKEKQRDVENAIKEEQSKVRLYLSLSGLAVFLLLTFFFWRESRQRAKTNRQLQKQQKRLDTINHNLESMVYERTKDLEDKNEKLYKYSYYLSHQIRGPISTIKGLVNIEKEGLVEPEDFVKMVNVCVADIDRKILEINDILHDQVPVK